MISHEYLFEVSFFVLQCFPDLRGSKPIIHMNSLHKDLPNPFETPSIP